MTDGESSKLTSDIARSVRELRLKRGLSARELADRSISAGAPSLTRSTIAKIESGVRRSIDVNEAAALAHALGITLQELVQPTAEPADAGRNRQLPPAHRPVDAAPAWSPATIPGGELADQVTAEIRRLRKGPGLQAADLGSRLGPLLRELAGDGDAAARGKALIAEIDRLMAELPGEFRACIEASLALSAETKDEPNFTARVNWVARLIDREYRTALRRVNAAELRLAELLAVEIAERRGHDPAAPEGWYIRELKAILRLDAETVESEEDRRIVAARPNLTEVMAWMDLPRDANQPGADLQARIRYGGSLLRREQPSRDHFKFMVQLPGPLMPGDEHQYGLILRMPRHMLRLPHYLLVPECKCEKFDLTIRFDPGRLPRWIRRVEGETVRKFENAEPAGDLLVPDAAGEVRQEFSNLSLYLGYGIQWAPQTTGAAIGWELHG